MGVYTEQIEALSMGVTHSLETIRHLERRRNRCNQTSRRLPPYRPTHHDLRDGE